MKPPESDVIVGTFHVHSLVVNGISDLVRAYETIEICKQCHYDIVRLQETTLDGQDGFTK